VRVANWPAACSTVNVTNLTSPQQVQETSAFYGTRRFIIVLTRARHLSTWLATVTQSTHSQPVLNVAFNIVLPSTPISFKWSPSFRFPHQNPVRTSPHACCMYYPPNSPLFHHSNAIRRGIQIMKGLVLLSTRTQYKHKQRILWLCGSKNLNWIRTFLRLPVPSLRHTATASPSYLVCSTFKSNHTQNASPETPAHISAHCRCTKQLMA